MKRRKEIVLTEKECPFAPPEQLGKYVIGRWTWFEKQEASDAATIIIDLERGITEWRNREYFTHMMLKCIKEHPEGFELSESYIQKELDPDVGERLKLVMLDVNGLTPEQQKDFLEHLSSRKGIPGSP